MSYPSVILAEPSLLAYFRLNQSVGAGTVTDSSPNAYTASTNAGTTLGGSSIVPSLADTTVTFSSTAVITGSTGLNSALNFDRTNPFSLECWVKPNVGRGSGAQTQIILDHRVLTNSQGYVLYLSWNSSVSKTTVNFILSNNVSTNAIIGNTTTTDLANGNVYHIVLTYDGSSTGAGVNVYVNGILVTFTVTTNNLSATTANAASVGIGNQVAAATLGFQGSLSEVSVYNAVLTQAQVAQHYYAGLGLPIEAYAIGTVSVGSTVAATITTYSNNDIILAFISNAYFSGSAATVSSISGGSLTWAKRSSGVNTNLGFSETEVWWAKAPTPLSGVTITATYSGSVEQGIMILVAATGQATFPWDNNSSLPAISQTGTGHTVTGVGVSSSVGLLMACYGDRQFTSSDLGNVPSGFIEVTGTGFAGGSPPDHIELSVAMMPTSAPQSGLTIAWGSIGTATAPVFIVDALGSVTVVGSLSMSLDKLH